MRRDDREVRDDRYKPDEDDSALNTRPKAEKRDYNNHFGDKSSDSGRRPTSNYRGYSTGARESTFTKPTARSAYGDECNGRAQRDGAKTPESRGTQVERECGQTIRHDQGKFNMYVCISIV